MALTHNLIRGWSSGSATISKRFTLTGGAEHNIDESLAAGSDQPVEFALDLSQLKSLYIVSSTAAVIETNSSGSAVNVITLAAGVPFMWATGDAPLRDTAGTAMTVDITSLFVTNADATLLQIRCLLDPTV